MILVSGRCGTPSHILGDAVSNVRLIARLDIKGPNLIKGVHLEGLRVIGSPCDFARRYYEQGIDEILYVDIVASLYGRSKLTDIVRSTAHDVFVPITVGGGIRSVSDVQELLRAGADKIAINTAAVRRPELVTEIARRFGSQCVVLSIEAKQQTSGRWEVFTDCGRERSGVDVMEWAARGVELGVGEILLTSIDQEGTRKGFDLALTRAVAEAVQVPVIASGGYGAPPDLTAVVDAGAAAVAVADAFHFDRVTVPQLRSAATLAGIAMRQV
jgi:imidazole glycerol-phosphate synthase subunit HisF